MLCCRSIRRKTEVYGGAVLKIHTSHDPAALTLGKESPVPIGYKAGWAPEQVWTRWQLQPLPGGEILSPSRSQSPNWLAGGSQLVVDVTILLK